LRTYEAVDDPYCYPGTTVLKNKLGLKKQSDLDKFEAEISLERSSVPLPSGKLAYPHYCAIHRHLFQDVYTWAGKPSTVRISKGGSMFCYPESIDREMKKLFKHLVDTKYFRGLSPRKFASEAAHFLAELNAIHPFREGNGRSQLSFLILLAERAGHPFDLAKMDAGGIMKAVIASFNGEEKPLADMILRLIHSV
jgi:cell filamentation protein